MNQVEYARQALAEAAATADPERLDQLVKEVARAEAVQICNDTLTFGIEHYVSDGMTPDEARQKVLRKITSDIIQRGPDDTWSGRGNDLRRAVFDAKIDWLRDRLAALA